MNDARTKIIFGDLAYDDLEALAKNVMLDRFSPWPDQAQLGKTARMITAKAHTRAKGYSLAVSFSTTRGTADNETAGTNRSTTHSIQESTAEAHNIGTSRSRSLTEGHAATTTHAAAETESSRTSSEADTSSTSESTSETDTETLTTSSTHGWSSATTAGESRATTHGTTHTVTTGLTPSISQQWGESDSHTIQPLPLGEQDRLLIQELKAIPTAHFLLKVPGKPAVVAQAPWVKEPLITKKTLAAGLQRVYALPYYTGIGDTHPEQHTGMTLVPRAPLPTPEQPLPAASPAPVGPPRSGGNADPAGGDRNTPVVCRLPPK